MARIVIANSLDKNAVIPMEVGLAWADKLNEEPLVLHGDKLADYETLDSVFAHLNLEVHQNYVQSILEANNAALNRQIEKLNGPIKGIKYESRSGTPAEVLLTETAKDDVNLIVLGHNTDKGLADKFLGGVTESIIHKSTKSVLITKNIKAAAPKKLMVAYDFSYHCDEAIKWAKKIAKANNAEIQLVNVIPCYYQGYHVAHTLHNGFNAALEEMIDESVTDIEKRLSHKVEELKGEGYTVTSKAILDKDGSIPDKLVEHINAEKGDLLLMGTHARGKIAELFLGSVASKMIKKSPASVLIAK